MKTELKTTEGEQWLLRECGFIHVTGLRTHNHAHPGDKGYRIGENVPLRQAGRWDSNNGKMVIITIHGEVWLAVADRGGPVRGGTLKTLVSQLAPNGQGAYVPCSNGEEIGTHALLARAANPDWATTEQPNRFS